MGNLVSLRHKKNRVNPQRAPRQNGLSTSIGNQNTSSVSHTHTRSVLQAVSLSFFHYSLGTLEPYCHTHTHTSGAIVPPLSARSLAWAERVSGHITLQLHHIPHVSKATRCPPTTKANALNGLRHPRQLSYNVHAEK